MRHSREGADTTKAGGVSAMARSGEAIRGARVPRRTEGRVRDDSLEADATWAAVLRALATILDQLHPSETRSRSHRDVSKPRGARTPAPA